MSEARLSEYRGTTGWLLKSRLRGYRLTIFGDRRVTVICECPEEHREALRPAFARTIRSLARGGA